MFIIMCKVYTYLQKETETYPHIQHYRAVLFALQREMAIQEQVAAGTRQEREERG